MEGSVRGSSHVESGLPRQDHYWIGSSLDGQIVAMVVCDGAGGVSHGGAGAALTTRVLRGLIQIGITESDEVPSLDALGSWLEIARERLDQVARSRNLPIEAFATTAMIAVSDGFDTRTAHIGDGFVAAELLDGSGWRSMSAPQRGEYAGTTAFLTDHFAYPVTSTFSGDIGRLCLSTDGLEPVAWNEALHAPHVPFFKGISKAVTASSGRDAFASNRLKVWLGSSDLRARVYDDLTLCMASRIAS